MVNAQPKPIEDHAVHSDRLIRHAWEQLEQGDRLQASEKAWGASTTIGRSQPMSPVQVMYVGPKVTKR